MTADAPQPADPDTRNAKREIVSNPEVITAIAPRTIAVSTPARDCPRDRAAMPSPIATAPAMTPHTGTHPVRNATTPTTTAATAHPERGLAGDADGADALMSASVTARREGPVARRASPRQAGDMSDRRTDPATCPTCGERMRFEILDDERFLVAWSCVTCGLIRTTEPA